jgi:hypothetical protein
MTNHINWQFFKPLVIFLFFILASSSGVAEPEIKADQIWTQMTEEQKREAILNYYQQQLINQSQPNQSNQPDPQCPEPSSNAVRDELNQLQTENARLQNKLRREEVVFIPPAF